MARNRMYWVLLEAQRGQIDLRLNDVPAQRLGDLGARRTPVNEYLVDGRNVATVHLGRNADLSRLPGPETPYEINVLIEEIIFDEDDDEVARRTLAEQQVQALLTPGDPRPLATLTFEAQPLRGLPDLAPFSRIGPAEYALIVEQLRQAAVWWSTGSAGPIVEWLQPYIADYVAAYPTEDEAEYRDDFAKMVRAYSPPKAKLDFDAAAVDLDLCAGGKLAECLTRHRQGAAIRMVRDETNYYDFNVIVGVRNGRVQAVR